MSNFAKGDIIMFREGHKFVGQPGRIESESQTGSFNIRMPNGTVCGAYPEDIFKVEEVEEKVKEVEPEIIHNTVTMHENESRDLLSSKGFKITIAIIIVIVTVLYFRGPNTPINIEQPKIELSPIDQKIQQISQKELSKGNEYKIQKDARDKQREQKKIEEDSVARVKATNDEIGKIKKEVMEIIK